MNEIFYEESAIITNEKTEKTKYMILNIISIFLYILSIALFFLIIFNFNLEVFSTGILNIVLNIVLSVLPLVCSIILAIFCGKMRDKFYNEFDYTFVSGSIRISKVIMHKKRKSLFKFDCSQIERMGLYPSDESEKYSYNKNVKINVLTSNNTPTDEKDFYYIVANINGEKYMLIFECTKTLMVNILSFTNKTVWENTKK